MKTLKEDENVLKAGLRQGRSMSLNESKPESIQVTDNLELTGKADDGSLLVRHRLTGSVCAIADTFAEIFSVMEISPAQSLFLFMEYYVD